MLARRMVTGPAAGLGPATGEAADEARLLARVAAGEAAAFRTLLDRHLGGAQAIARRMLADAAEADDVAQEAFLRLWTNRGRIEVGPGGVKPWLRRVVSNLSIDRIRARRNTDVTDEVPERIEPPTQLRDLEGRELQDRVKAALQKLPERQRQALVLFHYEGLSQVEVGAAMGVSDEAVESLLGRARRALKAALAGEWRALLPDGGGDGSAG